jgi:OFA family oxalate/formate antiporter-like MFS transporter
VPATKNNKRSQETHGGNKMANVGATSGQSLSRERWTQLIAGVICMTLIANLQYGWTLFVGPIHTAHGWDVASIQLAFSIFIALETWLTPLEGWIVDRLGAHRGPKLMVAIGGIFIALGWIVESKADTLPMLYLGSILAGIGGGAVYATAVGQAVKWFPDRRGLAVGLAAAGLRSGRRAHRRADPSGDRQQRL